MINKNKLLKRFLILLIVFSILIVPAIYASDGDYSIHNLEKHINILDDGTSVISEDVTYSISGTINGVYRDVKLSGGQTIENISVETPGYYNKLEVENSSNKVRLKVYLYTDEAKTQKVSDSNVEVIYHYNFLKGVKIYNDVAEFQYETWDSYWDSGVDNLVSYVQLPGSHDNVEMWYNPPNVVKTSTWTSDDTLKTEFNSLTSDEIAEQRILIPKEYFTSTDNADVINKDAKARIEQDQQNYQDSINTQDTIAKIISAIPAILMILPACIYFKYGREPKINYNAKYEADIPTNDSPAFVNVVMHDDVGSSDLLAFHSTLLNLIDKGYYKIINSNEDDLIIKQKGKPTNTLQQYELDIIDYLNKFRDKNNNISLKESGDAAEVYNFYKAWEIDLNHDVIGERVSKLFSNYGSETMNIVSILSIVGGILLIIISLMFLEYSQYIFMPILLSILLIIESIIVLLLPNTIMGQWTKEGKEFHDKWKNFENYIKDYSLIREYPPSSVQVWGKYLIYATALGCAKEVSKNMEQYFKDMNVPEDYYYDSDAMFYSMYWSDVMLLSVMHNDMDTVDTFDDGSFGDIGDIGGGFGGGGGGVF